MRFRPPPVSAFAVLVVAIAGAVLGPLLGPASPASAHAVLAAASPAQASVISTAPTAVRLTFSEPVQVVPGRSQVIAPDGRRINDGDPVGAGANLSIALLRADRPLGTYLVSFRVISADGHPVAGSYTFSVGAPSATPPAPASEGADPVVAVGLAAAKYLGYAGLLLVVGPLLMLARLWPARLSRRGPVRLSWVGLGLLGVSTLATLWLQAPYASGTGPLDVSPVELSQVLGSRRGLALLVRLAVIGVAAALLWWAVRRGGPRRQTGRPTWRSGALAALALVGLATWPVAGHPVVSPYPVLMAMADVTHLAAMAVWLGGLVVLVGFLLRRADRARAARDPPGVVAVGDAGHLLAGGRRGDAGADRSRRPAAPAGHPLRAVAARQDRPGGGGAGGGRVLPPAGAPPLRRCRRGAGPAAPHRRRRGGHRVGGAGRQRGAGADHPGRSAGIEAAAAAQATGFATTLTSPIYQLQFELFPAQVGPYNTLHAFVYTPDGRPADPGGVDGDQRRWPAGAWSRCGTRS